MKKLFLPVALGLLTLASCNDFNEDLTPQQITDSGDYLLVSVEEMGTSAATRAAIIEGALADGSVKKNLGWQEGDAVKLYGQYNWRTQIWKYNSEATAVMRKAANSLSAFLLDKEKSREKTQVFTQGDSIGYAIYPAELGEFTNEDRTEMSFTLDGDFMYSVQDFSSDDLTAGEFNVKTGAKIYKLPLPMWGYGVNGRIAFSFLTGFLHIHMQGMNATEADRKIVVTADYPLHGDFVAKDFDYDNSDTPTLVAAGWTKPEGEWTEEQKALCTLTITIPKATAGDNSIFIPLPAVKYNKLDIAYLDDSDNAVATVTLNEAAKTALTSEDGLTVSRNQFVEAEMKANEAKTATSLADINEILAAYSDYGREVLVDVALGADIAVPDPNSNAVSDNAKAILVPELKNDIVLNIKDNSITGTNTLVIKDKGNAGTGKLTINTGEKKITAPVEAQTSQTLALKGTYESAIEVKSYVDLELDGTFNGAITLPEDYSGNIALGGKYKEALNLTTSGDIKIATNWHMYGDGYANMTHKITANNVDVNAELRTNANITATTKVTVNNTFTRPLTITGNADICGKGNGSNAKLTVTGNAHFYSGANIITATVVGEAVLDEGVTLSSSEKFGTVTIAGILTTNGQTINGLKVNNPSTVTINGGIIKRIEAAYATADTEETVQETTVVNSTGNAQIIAATDANNKLVFKSTWDGSIVDAPQLNADNQYDVYTAAQFAALTKSKTRFVKSDASTLGANNSLVANIYASEIDLAGHEWSGIATMTGSGTTNAVKGLKSGTTIKSVTLTGKGFVNTVGGKNGTISNLKLEGVTYTGEAIDGIGALVGTVAASNETTIQNVEVSDVSIETVDGTNLGGLIGKATSGTITLDNIYVELTKLAGYHSIGGLIGSITEGADVTTETKAQVDNVNYIEFTKEVAEDAIDLNCGKIGKLVGTIGGNNSKLTLNVRKTSGSWSKKALGYNYNARLKEGTTTLEYFNGSGTYVGYSPEIGDENYFNSKYITNAKLNAYGEKNND